MEPWQQRVIDEKKELDIKRAKLTAFIESPNYQTVTIGEQYRLTQQLAAMGTYSDMLGYRIEAFKID